MSAHVPTAWPSQPVTPREFVEDVIPALFVDLELPDEARALELRLGIVLEGAGGGAWTLHLVEGELGVEAGVERCDFCLVQSVDDWRGALWEGRPGFVAEALRGALDPAQAVASPRPGPREWAALRALRGCVEVRVEGAAGLGGTPGAPSEWCLVLQLGSGATGRAVDARIVIGAAEAEAIRKGTLNPLEALMTGQLRLEGDLSLVLELQAIAFAATLAASAGQGPVRHPARRS